MRALGEASVQACEMEVGEDGESEVIQLTAAVVAAALIVGEKNFEKNFQRARGYARFSRFCKLEGGRGEPSKNDLILPARCTHKWYR